MADVNYGLRVPQRQNRVDDLHGVPPAGIEALHHASSQRPYQAMRILSKIPSSHRCSPQYGILTTSTIDQYSTKFGRHGSRSIIYARRVPYGYGYPTGTFWRAPASSRARSSAPRSSYARRRKALLAHWIVPVHVSTVPVPYSTIPYHTGTVPL